MLGVVSAALIRRRDHGRLVVSGMSAREAAAALDQHLLTIGAGDNVVRLLPPLIVTDADITEAVDKLDRACKALEAKA